jgi:hypothetical protein
MKNTADEDVMGYLTEISEKRKNNFLFVGDKFYYRDDKKQIMEVECFVDRRTRSVSDEKEINVSKRCDGRKYPVTIRIKEPQKIFPNSTEKYKDGWEIVDSLRKYYGNT